MLKNRYAMLKILMGPNVKIVMGQSFGSWTHGPGPMAMGPWALAGAAGPWATAAPSPWYHTLPRRRRPGGGGRAAAHAHVSRSQSFGP